MAAVGDMTLTDADIVALARSVSAPNMESIAEGYLGIEPETIANLKRSHREDVEGFNREIIRKWTFKTANAGPGQVQVSYFYLNIVFVKKPIGYYKFSVSF